MPFRRTDRNNPESIAAEIIGFFHDACYDMAQSIADLGRARQSRSVSDVPLEKALKSLG